MNRTNRLLAILLKLQANRWVRASDLADAFGVSARTIYRDMDSLDEAGIPVVAVPGKGYSLYEDYFIPPLMFTTDEALMLLLGSDYMAQNFEMGYQVAARSARAKIEAALSEPLKEKAETLLAGIRFVPVNAFDSPAEQALLPLLRRALVEQRTVRFHYADHEADVTRPVTVDPYGLLAQGTTWYLVGYAHARRDVRSFLLEHIREPGLLNDTFERPAGYRFRSVPDGGQRDVVVRVLFNPRVAHWLDRERAFYIAETETRPDGLLVTLKIHREAEVIPWLLGWGSYAFVLEPESLRRRLAHEARQMVQHYQHLPTLLA